jgi:hypothetical protein
MLSHHAPENQHSKRDVDVHQRLFVCELHQHGDVAVPPAFVTAILSYHSHLIARSTGVAGSGHHRGATTAIYRARRSVITPLVKVKNFFTSFRLSTTGPTVRKKHVRSLGVLERFASISSLLVLSCPPLRLGLPKYTCLSVNERLTGPAFPLPVVRLMRVKHSSK